MSQENGATAARDEFAGHLRKVLNALYDPGVLRASPLVPLFGLDQASGTASALRRVLLNAIESLRPNVETPLGSKTWRVYQVLRQRYTEQLTQRQVAAALGLSTRQLQREERLAREVLADHLWSTYDLDVKAHLVTGSTGAASATLPAEEASVPIPSRAEELEWLRSSVPHSEVDIGRTVEEVIETIGPLLESSGVSLDYARADLPPIRLREPALRQALLNVVSAAVSHAAHSVRIEVAASAHQVCIHVQAEGPSPGPSPEPSKLTESLEMCAQLVELCRGSLHVEHCLDGGPLFVAQIVLPAEGEVPVLVVDDNADAIKLFQRYVSGTRYRLVGSQNAEQALAIAQDTPPEIIVLDVMMPAQDGWTLLARFREHPRTHDVPIIVCTILPQEQLALTLGAADFVRKPASRRVFLSALDRGMELAAREPC